MLREFDGVSWNDAALVDTHISDPLGEPGRAVVRQHTRGSDTTLFTCIIVGDTTLLLLLLSRTYQSSVAVSRIMYCALSVLLAAGLFVLPPPMGGTFHLMLYATTTTIIDLHSTFRTVALWEAFTPERYNWKKVVAAFSYILSQVCALLVMHTYAGSIVLGVIVAASMCTAIHPPPIEPVNIPPPEPYTIAPYGLEEIAHRRDESEQGRREMYDAMFPPVSTRSIMEPFEVFFQETQVALQQMTQHGTSYAKYAQLASMVPTNMTAQELLTSSQLHEAMSAMQGGHPPPLRDHSISVEDEEDDGKLPG